MSLSIVRLRSSNTIHLLADGLVFKVVSRDEGVTDTITETNSRRIISFLNGGVEIEKIIARIKAGEKLDDIDKTASLTMSSREYSNTNFMILTVIVNDVSRKTWTGAILRDEGTIHLPAGVINDILGYLVSIGIKPNPRNYYTIKYVDKLPITSRTDICFVLTAEFGDKPVGSAWRWNGEKWETVKDADDGGSDEGGDSGLPEDRYGDFIISESEPEGLEPGIIWGRVERL